jgi:hypothetical protein
MEWEGIAATQGKSQSHRKRLEYQRVRDVDANLKKRPIPQEFSFGVCQLTACFIFCRKPHKGSHIRLAIHHVLGEDDRNSVHWAIIGTDSAVPAFVLILHYWGLFGREPVDDVSWAKIITNRASFPTYLWVDHNRHWLHTS